MSLVPHLPDLAPSSFFQEQRSFAEVKQELLVKYFDAWCSSRIAVKTPGAEEPLLFVDLNAAAAQETQPPQPLAVPVTQQLIRSAGKIKGGYASLQFYFSDPARPELAVLAQELAQLPAYEALVEAPAFLHAPENRLMLEERLAAGLPALLFMDPFSYGYAQEMLLKACNSWRSDLFLLLNPNSLRRALTGKKVSQPLTELLGERLPHIYTFCRKEKHNGRRETYILQQLQGQLREKGFFTLLFQINQPGTDSASHYVLISSPEVAAYHIFKQMVLPYSEFQPDGVPLFVSSQGPQHQLSLFAHRPEFSVTKLIGGLANSAAQWKFKSIEKIHEMHSLNTAYIRKNYLIAFEHLRDQGKVELLNGKTLQTVRKATYSSVVKYIL